MGILGWISISIGLLIHALAIWSNSFHGEMVAVYLIGAFLQSLTALLIFAPIVILIYKNKKPS